MERTNIGWLMREQTQDYYERERRKAEKRCKQNEKWKRANKWWISHMQRVREAVRRQRG